jgi:uncharacterized membrane protein
MRALPAVLTVAATVWLGSVCVAPVGLAHGRVPMVTMAVYEAGSRICHQRPERSFHVSGVQLPVCARCFGLYLAAALGAAAALAAGRGSGGTGRAAIAFAALPLLASVGPEWVGVVEGTNVTRFLSALPFGAVVAWVLISSLSSAPATSMSRNGQIAGG